MPAAWEIKVDDSRQEDTRAAFIIFCEDGVDEPIYFNAFQDGRTDIKINVIPNQRAGKLNLSAALAFCVDNKFVDYIDGKIVLKDNLPHNIWCVYDRDLESEQLELVSLQNDVAFTVAIQTAESAGVNVAWSNDAFELWILLHFEEVTVGKCHRSYIYQRLTEIFKSLPDKSDALATLVANEGFDYKTHMKREKSFVPFVHPLLKERRTQAIAHAQELERRFDGSVPYHDRNPCTRAHLLVARLLTVEP